MREMFLTTPRIGFSTWQADDLPLATRLWGDTDVTRYICATGIYTTQEIEARLAAERDNQRQHGMQYWPIFLLETGEFLGCCGLRPYFPEPGVLELGFHLCHAHWGKGLGTEAARAAMQYGVEALGAKALFAGHNPHNTASAAVLGKLGFCYTHDELYPPTGLEHPSYRFEPAGE